MMGGVVAGSSSIGGVSIRACHVSTEVDPRNSHIGTDQDHFRAA